MGSSSSKLYFYLLLIVSLLACGMASFFSRAPSCMSAQKVEQKRPKIQQTPSNDEPQHCTSESPQDKSMSKNYMLGLIHLKGKLLSSGHEPMHMSVDKNTPRSNDTTESCEADPMPKSKPPPSKAEPPAMYDPIPEGFVRVYERINRDSDEKAKAKQCKSSEDSSSDDDAEPEPEAVAEPLHSLELYPYLGEPPVSERSFMETLKTSLSGALNSISSKFGGSIRDPALILDNKNLLHDDEGFRKFSFTGHKKTSSGDNLYPSSRIAKRMTRRDFSQHILALKSDVMRRKRIMKNKPPKKKPRKHTKKHKRLHGKASNYDDSDIARKNYFESNILYPRPYETDAVLKF